MRDVLKGGPPIWDGRPSSVQLTPAFFLPSPMSHPPSAKPRAAASRTEFMLLFEAIRLALSTIRAQKLKSFFTLLGVTIGVMFLIAVVSIVEGMGRYVEDDFAGRMLGANTFTLRRYPWFGNNTTREQWMEWQRRPRFYVSDVSFVRSVLPTDAHWAVESQDNAMA